MNRTYKLTILIFSLFFFSRAAIAAQSCADLHPELSGFATKLVDAAMSSCSESFFSLRARLQKEGFSCTAPSADSGSRCRGPLSGYSQPINIYIPSRLRDDKDLSLAYHFTGFTNSAAFNPFTKANGDYGRYLTRAKKNALMIIPESTGKDSTYASDLNTPLKMNRFFSHVTDLLNKAGAKVDENTPIVLSGHSGAAMQLARMGNWAASGQVPYLKNVRGIGLFDSVYTKHFAGLTRFEKVMKENGSSYFFSAYNPAGSNAATNRQLQRSLDGSDDNFVSKFTTNHSIAHMSFMKNYMTGFLDHAISEEDSAESSDKE